MNQQIAPVTGANTSIGRITAFALADRGYPMMFAGRPPERTKLFLDDISTLGKFEPLFFKRQLNDLESVRDYAAAVLRTSLPTHLLISNAGLALQRGQTPQTYEVSSPSSHRKAISISQIAQPTRTTSSASNVFIPEYLWGFSEAAGA
ncbi:MAG: SDR family NAD(P)-dependent oxidoreductase [Betaproteobacteria bacterium]